MAHSKLIQVGALGTGERILVYDEESNRAARRNRGWDDTGLTNAARADGVVTGFTQGATQQCPAPLVRHDHQNARW